ncbi:hypothetical protein HHK36_015194 [Tetracentron sinense]|uniref:HhH-GPD domain-containing protein n=1 Tax=Tetracentron sinense TaxID=13715 RepID=A0A834Z1J7_TETSI|nr:hypothetical protein HHK36_015194 [Tetracentron sinense]
MQKIPKRKQQELKLRSSSNTSPSKSARINDSVDEPYPAYPRPSPEECRIVRDDLMSLHGFPQEFAKYRIQRRKSHVESTSEENRKESVLDGLVSILLSQNTTDLNSQRAFASLKSAFPIWEDVLAADSKCIENAIRCGGLAVTKASCIKNILSCLLEKKGKICLEYLRDMSANEIKAELCQFKGIGPKTVACLLMFHLQQDDFPVDTHVFRITKAIGWVPTAADREKAYLHLNKRMPNELKFELNCLFVTHGKLCHRCTNKGGGQQKRVSDDNRCPLSTYSMASNN